MNKGIVHAMAQSEKSLFMMALFVTTVTDSLRRNAKVIKNPLPLKRMWHRGPLRVKGIGEMKRSIEQRAWGRGRIGDFTKGQMNKRSVCFVTVSFSSYS